MAAPGPRPDHDPDACLDCSDRLDPGLLADRDAAIEQVTAALSELGDPVADVLERMNGDEFAGLVWSMEQAPRRRLLQNLGIPPAKRPTPVAAGHGLAKLRKWPGDERDHAIRHATGPVVRTIVETWRQHRHDDDLDDALIAVLTANPERADSIRLTVLTHFWGADRMTLALRLSLQHGLALPAWHAAGLDRVIDACHRLEQVWSTVVAVLQPEFNPETNPAPTTTPNTERTVAAAGEPDEQPPVSPSDPTVDEPDEETVGQRHLPEPNQASAPATGTPAVAPAPPMTPAARGESIAIVEAPALGKLEDDPAVALSLHAGRLTSSHEAALEAARKCADTLAAAGVPDSRLVAVITAFIDVAGEAHRLLADVARPVPADAGLGDLTDALRQAAEASSRHGQRARLAPLTAVRGPDDVRDQLDEISGWAAELVAAPTWTPEQQRQADGLRTLLDIIDSAAAGDMQAAAQAHMAAQQQLPARLMPVTYPAMFGNLLLTTAAPDDASTATAGSAMESSPGPATPAVSTSTVTAADEDAVAAESVPDTAPDPVPPLPRRADSTPPGATVALSEPVDTAGLAPDPQPPATLSPTPTESQPAATSPKEQPPPASASTADWTSAGTVTMSRDLIRTLLAAGRVSLAGHAARAAGDARTADALHLFALADATRSETSPIAMATHAALEQAQRSGPAGDPPAHLLMFAAALRVSLAAADATGGEIVVELSRSMPHLPALGALGDAIGAASTHGWLYSAEVLAELAPIAGADNDVAAAVARAAAEARRPRNVEFVRANTIIDRWWSRTGLIGRLLDAAAHDRQAEVETVAEDLRWLVKNVDSELKRVDSELRIGSGKPLQGQVRRRLKTMVDTSAHAVSGWIEVVRATQRTAGRGAAASPYLTNLRQDVKQLWSAAEQELTILATERPETLLAEAAIVCRGSIRRSVGMLDGVALGGTDRDPGQVLNQDLLCAPDLPIGADGTPGRPVTTADVTAAADTSWQDAFAARLQQEEFAAANRIIAAAPDDDRAEMRQRLTTAVTNSQDQLRALRRTVEQEVARAARLGQLDEAANSTVTGQLEAADPGSGDPDFGPRDLGVVRRRLQDIMGNLPGYREQAQQVMRRRVAAEPAITGPDADSRRAAIIARIDDGDLATAEEYLLAAINQETPPTATPSSDLSDFLDLIDALPEGITNRLIADIRAGRSVAGLDFGQLPDTDRDAAASGLESALEIRTARADTLRSIAVARVLRLAGIEFTTMTRVEGLPGGGRRTWRELSGVVRNGKPLSPRFASLAGDRQRILVCWGGTEIRTLIGWLEQDHSDLPVLVLLQAPLGRQQRTDLALACATRPGKPVIVLDDIALTHLAAHGSGQFPSMERILLPFAAVNPYVPPGSGGVPSEMFYGRNHELSSITDGQGPNLLYGGRQLGKTALLHAAARRFVLTRNWRAIYVVMPNVVGVGVNPAALWDRVAEKLAELDIAVPKGRWKDPGDKVVASIKAWLDGDSTRRLLLLIDECDEFFNADADRGFTAVTALRNLRDQTERRFKPVFAGLHQVQRFAHLPNQPLAGAHFGEQLAIGPLSPGPAYQLLFTPMEALGIRFAAPELIHRILAYCNYQPKLLQLVGRAVVDEAVSRRPGGPPYVIGEEILDRVFHSATLQRQIREIVHLTLDLDPRYKMIALMVALDAYEHGADHTLSMPELRVACERWWPEGFAGRGIDEFTPLLEEMRDLGVLTTSGGRWRLRSGNVLRLLGTAAEIDDELCSDQWNTVPTQSSAEQARRAVTAGLVSPCTEQQLSRLTTRGNHIRVIVGTRATAVGRVRSLLELAKETGARFALSVTRTAAAYGTQLRRGEPGGDHRIVLDDLTGSPVDMVLTAIGQAERIQPDSGVSRTVVVVVDAAVPGMLGAVTGTSAVIGADLVVPLRRVTPAGLRSWTAENEPLHMFRDHASRSALMDATGGWPLLLDRAVELAAQQSRATKICDLIKQELAGREMTTQLLEATGLLTEARLTAAFEQLVEYDESVDEEELIALCSDFDADPAGAAAALKLLDVLVPSGKDGRWLPEPVVLRAWRVVGSF
ncbi:hypothetical protein [Actinoplanes sp. NPDC049802]|uniref:hypothetical protein n=1 Tax=Actinoplanes sp. NPDC049802 TaxID=3154742 RepID=UPI0033EAC800